MKEKQPDGVDPLTIDPLAPCHKIPDRVLSQIHCKDNSIQIFQKGDDTKAGYTFDGVHYESVANIPQIEELKKACDNEWSNQIKDIEEKEKLPQLAEFIRNNQEVFKKYFKGDSNALSSLKGEDGPRMGCCCAPLERFGAIGLGLELYFKLIVFMAIIFFSLTLVNIPLY